MNNNIEEKTIDVKVNEYLKKPYLRLLMAEPDGGFSAQVLEFSGCFAEGNTAKETMENLENTMESWILTCLARGITIPEPFVTDKTNDVKSIVDEANKKLTRIVTSFQKYSPYRDSIY